MNQQGFSAVVLLVVIVVLASIGGAGYMMMQNNSESAAENDSSDEVATTSPSGKTSNENGTKAKGVAKSKVDVCDILTIEKVSSITGVPMRPISEISGEPQVPYEDGDLWLSTCAYYNPNIESSDGVTVTFMEALSSEAKEGLEAEWENSKSEMGVVNISGFGDEAFKINEVSGSFVPNQYNVMVGNIIIIASSGIGHASFSGEALPEFEYTEQTDAVTEEVLRYVISQLR